MDRNEVEYRKELEELKHIIGDDKETITRLNHFIKLGKSVAGFLDPSGTGAIISVTSLITDLIDTIKGQKDQIDAEDTTQRFIRLIELENAKIHKLQDQLLPLIPQTCLIADVDNWVEIKEQSRGISSITDNSKTSFNINFTTTLHNPDDYFVHINLPTKQITLTNSSITIVLQQEQRKGSKVKLYLAKMSDKAW
ncbi:hypothetical protein AB6D75_19460 [Vibrio splendidus]